MNKWAVCSRIDLLWNSTKCSWLWSNETTATTLQHYNNITIRSLLFLRKPPARRAQTSLRSEIKPHLRSRASTRHATPQHNRSSKDAGSRMTKAGTGLIFELGIETQTDLLNPTEGNVLTTPERCEAVDRHSRVGIIRTGSFKDQSRGCS